MKQHRLKKKKVVVHTSQQHLENVQNHDKSNVEGQNTGRWTQEQHKIFLEGYAQFGKNWKNISTIVKTRNPSQVRSHAQKYFYKLEKDSSAKDALLLHQPRKLRNRQQIKRTTSKTASNSNIDPMNPTFNSNNHSFSFRNTPLLKINQQMCQQDIDSYNLNQEQLNQNRNNANGNPINMSYIPGQIMLPLSYFMEYVYPTIVGKGETIQSLIEGQNNKTQEKQAKDINKLEQRHDKKQLYEEKFSISSSSAFKPYRK